MIDKVYNLVGNLVDEFQRIEKYLELLVLCNDCEEYIEQGKIVNVWLFQNWDSISKKPMGEKLKAVYEIDILRKKDDKLVLDYIKEKRNYIVHSFFVDNKDCNEDKIKELLFIKKEVEIVRGALEKFVREQAKNLKNL